LSSCVRDHLRSNSRLSCCPSKFVLACPAVPNHWSNEDSFVKMCAGSRSTDASTVLPLHVRVGPSGCAQPLAQGGPFCQDACGITFGRSFDRPAPAISGWLVRLCQIIGPRRTVLSRRGRNHVRPNSRPSSPCIFVLACPAVPNHWPKEDSFVKMRAGSPSTDASTVLPLQVWARPSGWAGSSVQGGQFRQDACGITFDRCFDRPALASSGSLVRLCPTIGPRKTVLSRRGRDRVRPMLRPSCPCMFGLARPAG